MARWEDIVVGGGLVGAAVARRLAEGGRRVVIVEKGRAVTAVPGEHLRNGSAMQQNPDGFFGEIDQYFDYVDPGSAPAGLPGAFTTNIGGGMGIAWTNNCPRAIERVDRPALFERSEWNQMYAQAERHLSVRSDQFEDSARGHIALDRLASFVGGQGRELTSLPLSGVRTAPERIRYIAPADILRGAAGDVDEVVGAVERVLFEGSRTTGVVIEGETIQAQNVIICAGSVETPMLLWRSGVTSEALGRHLSFHPVLMAQVVLDSQELADLEGPDPLPRICIPPTIERPWLTMLLRDTNPFEVESGDHDVPPNQLIEIQVFQPIEPTADNRMFMSDGIVRFDVPMREADLARKAAIEQDVQELGRLLGRFRGGCHPQWAAFGTPHLMGSCRMGDVDDGRSVVDEDGRLWGTQNLFVASNGVIPSALAVNPTLTTIAIALRTADRINGALEPRERSVG